MNQLLAHHALKYASHGWRVFPCLPRQKVPATKHGIKDATIDLSQIREWWAKNPNYNVAIACGRESDVYVIDVDVQEATSVSGWNTLQKLADEGKFISETVRQNTPRGGAHFFYCATLPPTSRNNFMSGIDIRSNGFYVVTAPSIHPNGGQYTWAPGFAPWENGLAQFPDFMRPTTRAPWQPSRGAICPDSVTGIHDSAGQLPNDILQRASAYLQECDPAIQGAGGHSSLLWAAVALVHGFCLSNEQALNLLIREYNGRCIPPWDLSLLKEERDFSRKVPEARKLIPQHPPGWLLNDPAFASLDSNAVDVEQLIKTCKVKPPKLKVPLTLLPNKELEFLTQPTGLLGRICSWINLTAIRKQPLLTLGCVLAFLGALFGRKVRDTGGLRTNIYCMGIGKSSYGKAHAPDQIRALCEAASCTDLLGGIDFASDPSIETRLTKYPATLFLLDEIGYILLNIKSGSNQHLRGVVPTLMKLYSSAKSIYKGKEYAEDGKQRVLIQPCCCIFGYSTPERFNAGISPDELQDGWLSRCLVFNVKTKPKKIRGLQVTLPPVEICDQVHAWFTRQIEPLDTNGDIGAYARHRGDTVTSMPPQQIIAPTTLEAEKVFVAFDNETEATGRANPLLDCLWSKGEENARKIALIMAASENFDEPIISVSNADYACRLIRYLLIDFGTVASAITFCATDARKQKLLEIIKNAGIEGCLKRDLTRKSQWLNGRERVAMLADLVEAEEIVQQMKPNTKRMCYWVISEFRLHLKQAKK